MRAARTLAAALVLPLLLAAQARAQNWLPRGGQAANVILVVAGGMSPEALEAGRLHALGPAGRFSFEDLGPKASFNTDSLSTEPGPDRVPGDKAAAATAFATGRRVQNQRLSLAEDGTRLLTILEIAQLLGKATGIVTNSFLEDGTVAAFAAHVARDLADRGKIREQMLLQRLPTVLLGGGFKSLNTHGYLGPRLHPSYRTVFTREAMEALAPSAPVTPTLGVFQGFTELPLDRLANRAWWFVSDAALSPGFIRDEYPGRAQDPSLAEMTRKALALLEPHRGGFFLVVGAEHLGNLGEFAARSVEANRPRITDFLVREARVLDDAVRAVLAWRAARPNPEDTLVVVAADADAGGLVRRCRAPGGGAASCASPGAVPRCWVRDGAGYREQDCGGTGSLPAVDYTADFPTFTTFREVNAWAAGPGAEIVVEAERNTDVYYAMQYAFTGTADPIFPPEGIP